MNYVPLYVPEPLFDEVERYVVELKGITPTAQVRVERKEVEPDNEPAALDGPREWPREKLVALWNKLPDDTKTLITMQMNQPGRPVGMAEYEDAMDGSFSRVQAAGRSLSAHMRKVGMPHWPFDAAVDPRTGRFAYTMSERTAAIFRELAESHD